MQTSMDFYNANAGNFLLQTPTEFFIANNIGLLAQMSVLQPFSTRLLPPLFF